MKYKKWNKLIIFLKSSFVEENKSCHNNIFQNMLYIYYAY